MEPGLASHGAPKDGESVFNPMLSIFNAVGEEEEDEDAPLPALGGPGSGGVSLPSNLYTQLFPMQDKDDEMDVATSEDINMVATSNGLVSSQDFTEAYAGITADPWDCMSWYLYLQEAELGRSGSVSVHDAYSKFLTQFPTAYKYWNKEILYFLNRNDFAMCDSLFAQCLAKSRSVDLWSTYIEFTRRKANVDALNKTNSQLTSDRQVLENAFEKAMESVGMSMHSGGLWREYIDFVRSWPEVSNNIDSGRKLLALRKLYQRALCVPTDNLEFFWREYEMLERSAGELLAERVLPEYSDKYLHASAVYKERVRYHAAIDFDRLAVPPTVSTPQQTQSVTEVRELLGWDNLIRYERTNPDNLAPEPHRQYLLMLFTQFAACFRYHPEVWIELSKLEQQSGHVQEARIALKEGIELIPEVCVLRFALAEFEESQNLFDSARDVYRIAFEAIPSALTFATFQRFVRRREGVAAARRLFSETLPLRQSRRLGIDTYLAHALLELEVNCKPEVALKILHLAREFDVSACLSNLNYIRLCVRVLLRMGDLEQIRWIMQCVLSEDMHWTSSALGATVKGSLSALSPHASNLSQTSALGPGGVVVTTVIASGIPDTLLNADVNSGANKQQQQQAGDDSGSQNASNGVNSRPIITFTLQEQLQLWDDYLLAEVTLGLSSVARLDELRGYRDRVKQILLDLEAQRNTSANQYSSISSRTTGIFNSCADLVERYAGGPVTIPVNDDAVRLRSKGKKCLTDLLRTEREKQTAMREAVSSRAGGGSGGASGVAGLKRARALGDPVDSLVDDAASSLATVPVLLREFLARLPHNYASVAQTPGDHDMVVRQLRNLVLPPKPSMEDIENANLLMNEAKKAKVSPNEEEEDFEAEHDIFLARDDIFKRRQRERLLH